MSKPNLSPYKDALTAVMSEINELPDVVFIGQQIVYAGNPMSTTLGNVSKDKMIELPVMEESQMGISLGLAMTDKIVVSFYPRWDFFISASNQLINHLDKYEIMTGKKAHILIRLGKGSDQPLDPGHQHKGSYFDEYKSLSPDINYYNLQTVDDIHHAYKKAISEKGIHVLVEYPQYYYVN